MFKYPVIDTHIHMYSEKDLLEIERAAKIGEYSAYTLLSSSFAPQTAPGNLSIIWAKLKNRKEVYGYASLHPSEDEKIDGNDLLQQAKLPESVKFIAL